MRLEWDLPLDRIYETGLDRGVLFLTDRSGVAWNGLLSINESLGGKTHESLFFDGEKQDELFNDSSFSATMSAVTYPDEFLEFDGFGILEDGLLVDNQESKPFHLSYRTLVGDAVNGEEAYKIHILYNVTAIGSDVTYQTTDSDIEPLEFNWDITSVPERLINYTNTAHVIIDSRFTQPFLLDYIESLLYGTDDTEPYLPPLEELITDYINWNRIIIIDNGDGTWTATGPDEYITMLDPHTFQIENANSYFIDADTYTISSSVLD